MSVSQTESTMRAYLDALIDGGDFADFFSDDVLWTTMETGDEISGREAVRHYIVGLHSHWFEARPELRGLTVGDGLAGLEAVFVARHVSEFAGIPATGIEVRLPYSVFYDIDGATITALRAYFPVTVLMHELRRATSISA